VLTADGYLRKNHVELTVAGKDYSWVEKFKSCVSSNAPIKIRTRDGCARFYFTSSRISECLRNYGLHQNKSLTVKFCNQVPEKQIHHYIRGLCDGDGSIFRKGKTGWGLELMGTFDVVSQVDYYLSKHRTPHSKALTNTIRPRTNNFVVRYQGVLNVGHILDWMYKNATLFLERKKDLATIIWEKAKDSKEHYKCGNYTENDLLKLYSELLTWKKVAEYIGVNIRNLHRYKKKLKRSLGGDRNSLLLTPGHGFESHYSP
jgi:hypothetical protein